MQVNVACAATPLYLCCAAILFLRYRLCVTLFLAYSVKSMLLPLIHRARFCLPNFALRRPVMILFGHYFVERHSWFLLRCLAILWLCCSNNNLFSSSLGLDIRALNVFFCFTHRTRTELRISLMYAFTTTLWKLCVGYRCGCEHTAWHSTARQRRKFANIEARQQCRSCSTYTSCP